jgi:two-component system cell cycle sensor histidine kinase/response regulator CckA
MTRPLRVLHLEDNPRDAEMVRCRLEADGVSCAIQLTNGKASFEAALAREPFDLIISDYNLPGYDGLAALKQAQAAQPDVPVILISGTVSEEEAVKVLRVGATDYLIKTRLDRLAPAALRAIEEAETRLTRRRAEVALAQSERRKGAILDSVLDCIVTIGADGRVIEFNAAAERTFGYTKAQAIGCLLSELIIPPLHRAAHAAGMARYLDTGEGPLIGNVIEITAMRSDGSELPVELAITAILGEEAPIFTGVLRDITARKRADETRARLAAIVDSSDDAIFSMDLDGTLLTWNAGAERLYGYAAREVIGRSRTILAPPGTTGEFTEILAKAARGETGEPFETQRRRKDGSLVDISITISPMTDASGRVTNMSAIARDISSRKRAEVAVRAADERMRFALESANVGIWDMDYTTGALTWSETLESQYGLQPGTFGGTFEAFLPRIHPDDREAVVDTIGRAVQSGTDFTTEHRAVWPDGTVRWLSGAGRIYIGDQRKPVRGVGISLDVTERRGLAAQYQQAQKMEAIGQLAGGVAHDFNNLLTVILGNCELAMEDVGGDNPCRDTLTEIQTAGLSAAALTRQLLALSRKEIIAPTLLDLNVVLADIRAMLRRLIREDVEVVLGLRPELAPVKADRGQMEQIILNLAVNARDAMPKGGTLTIEISNVELDDHYAKAHVGVTPGPYVALTVSDTGAGMTPEVQARLFEPFFTTKEVGKGTGLGLATVHGIVSQSGGSVRVTSQPGKGTAFQVYLPRADEAGLSADVPAPVARARAGGETVLLVEDADGLRVLATKLLERLGYAVLVAANADEALQVFEAHPSIDVLLTDVVMPGGSGPELTSRLVERRPGLQVIYMSGYTDETIVHHGVLEPGIAFLQKPFSSETLGRKIREVLDR